MDIKQVLALIDSVEQKKATLTEGKNMAKDMVMQHYTKKEIKSPIKKPVSRLNEYFKVVDNEMLNVIKEEREAKRVEVKSIVNRVLERLDEGKKTAPPKTELEKHSKLKTTLEYKEKNSMKISDLVEANYSYAADDEGISPEEQLRRAKLLGFQTPRTVSYKDIDGVEASFQHTVHGSLIDLNWTVNGKDYDSWVEKGMLAFRDPQNLKKNVAFHQTQLNTQLQQGNERKAKNHAYKIGSMSAHLQDAEQYQRVKDKVAQLSQGASGSATDKTATNKQQSAAAVNSIPVDSNVQKLQQAILKRDPKALPRYGADGKLGKETRTAMAKYPDIAKQFPGIKEGKEKLSAQEKFKRGVKRAGYDMDAGAKRIEDLLAKQKKEREERERKEKEQGVAETNQPEAPKPRNFVAKNAKTAGAGAHKDKKKAEKLGDVKHKKEKVPMDKSEQLDEKAVSKAQQKFMGMVHAAKKGEKPASKEVAKAAKGMSGKAAKDFASTKHKGLPNKKVDEEKKKGTHGKACWDGYRRVGQNDCVKVSEAIEVGSPVKVYSNVLKKPVLGTVVAINENKAYVNYNNTKIVMGHPISKVELNEAAAATAAKVAGQAAPGMLAKAARFLPGVGLVAGGYDAYKRAQAGDYTGAALSAGAGLAGLVPGLGTAVSTGLIGAQMGRDYAKTGSVIPGYDEIGKAAQKGQAPTPTPQPNRKTGAILNGSPESIKIMQKKLSDAGAKNTDGTPLVADGKIGSNTQAAMKQFPDIAKTYNYGRPGTVGA